MAMCGILSAGVLIVVGREKTGFDVFRYASLGNRRRRPEVLSQGLPSLTSRAIVRRKMRYLYIVTMTPQTQGPAEKSNLVL